MPPWLTRRPEDTGGRIANPNCGLFTAADPWTKASSAPLSQLPSEPEVEASGHLGTGPIRVGLTDAQPNKAEQAPGAKSRHDREQREDQIHGHLHGEGQPGAM